MPGSYMEGVDYSFICRRSDYARYLHEKNGFRPHLFTCFFYATGCITTGSYIKEVDLDLVCFTLAQEMYELLKTLQKTPTFYVVELK